MGETFNTIDAQQLWKAFAAGDQSAWGELVNQFRAPLIRYVSVKGVADAEDVARETFARLADKPDGNRLFQPWMYTVADGIVSQRA